MSHKRQWKSPRMRNSLVQTCLRATYSFRCHASHSVVGSSDSSLPLPCTPPCTAVSALIPSPTTANAGPFLIPFLPPSHSGPDSTLKRPGPGGELSPASQPPFVVSTMAPSRACHQWPMAAFHSFRSFPSVATLVQLQSTLISVGLDIAPSPKLPSRRHPVFYAVVTTLWHSLSNCRVYNTFKAALT